MRTVERPVSVHGMGIHTGFPVRVTLLPALEFGVFFKRVDIPESPLIAATPDNIEPSTRNTVLRRGDASIATIEHLLAACHGLGVDGLVVEVDGEELPALDGSALPWVEVIGRAGVVDTMAAYPDDVVNDEWSPEGVSVEEGDAFISLVPAPGFSVTFSGIFPDGIHHTATWSPAGDFRGALAGARTFCRLKEVVELRRAGLIRGGTPDNAIVWVDIEPTPELAREVSTWWPGVLLERSSEGILNSQKLRWDDEPVRHKLLDLLGDLALVRPISRCMIHAHQAGHALTHRFLSLLQRRIMGG